MAARAKFSHADEMLFTRDGLEQASSEGTVQARRRPVRRRQPGGRPVLRHRRQPDRAGPGRRPPGARDRPGLPRAWPSRGTTPGSTGPPATWPWCAPTCARSRWPVSTRSSSTRPGGPAGGGCGQATASRRSAGAWTWPVRSQAVGIKAAPGLPRDLVPEGWEAEFVAVGRDLKEALLWSPALATAGSRATVLPSGDTLTPAPGHAADIPVAAPGAFLFDPSPAVTRAGLVEDLARQLDAWKIDPEIAFLSADREHHSPFARTLRVLESAPWHERHFARQAAGAGHRGRRHPAPRPGRGRAANSPAPGPARPGPRHDRHHPG